MAKVETHANGKSTAEPRPLPAVEYTAGEPGTAGDVGDALNGFDFVTVRHPALSPPGTATFGFAGLGLAVAELRRVINSGAVVGWILPFPRTKLPRIVWAKE